MPYCSELHDLIQSIKQLCLPLPNDHASHYTISSTISVLPLDVYLSPVFNASYRHFLFSSNNLINFGSSQLFQRHGRNFVTIQQAY
eukprot:scaffold93582_cov39-Prasinocladus_malaysianus.AAC.1